MPTSKPGAKTAPLERQNYPLERQAKAQFEVVRRAYEGGAFDDLCPRHEARGGLLFRVPGTGRGTAGGILPEENLRAEVLARVEGLLGEEMLPRVAILAYKAGARAEEVWIWGDLKLGALAKLVRRRHRNREKRRRATPSRHERKAPGAKAPGAGAGGKS